MTKQEAINKAERIARKRGECIYVVYDDDNYHLATGYDLATFYQAVPDSDIVYCASEY